MCVMKASMQSVAINPCMYVLAVTTLLAITWMKNSSEKPLQRAQLAILAAG